MKVFRKRMFSLALVVVFLAATSIAYASPAPPPDSSKAHKEIGIQSLQYLQDWGCAINSSGNGYITISGFTNAYQPVDYIAVTLYLQRWDGSNWVDLGSWSFSNYLASSVNGAKGLQVTKGYYYRTRAVHSATESGNTESAQSYSGYIYVN